MTYVLDPKQETSVDLAERRNRELMEFRIRELAEFRNRSLERGRIASLMSLLPGNPGEMNSALDVGARDGFISKLLTERFSNVTALDLETPAVDHERIHCVKGEVTDLNFPDASFDLVVCAEVLEHVPARMLSKACDELSRIAKEYLLIGVPYKQDLRQDRTTCYTCGEKNPPWGHLNSFDESRLRKLFQRLEMTKVSFAGEVEIGTNFISAFLMDLGGNLYGAYWQEEPCVHCGAMLRPPPEKKLWRRALTRAAIYAREAQRPFCRKHPTWIHVLFQKRPA